MYNVISYSSVNNLQEAPLKIEYFSCPVAFAMNGAEQQEIPKTTSDGPWGLV